MKTDIVTNSYFNGRDLRISDDDGRSARVNVKEGRYPAVEVKDDAYHGEPGFFEAQDAIGEARSEAIYESIRRDFWEIIAPEIAAEHEFGSHVLSLGNSGGWCAVENGTGFLDYVTGPDWTIPPADDDADDESFDEYADAIAERDRFYRFALDIVAAVERAREEFIESVQNAARVAELVDACWRD